MTTCVRAICGWTAKAATVRARTGCPPRRRYCFGPPSPARSPRPAATIRAAVDVIARCSWIGPFRAFSSRLDTGGDNNSPPRPLGRSLGRQGKPAAKVVFGHALGEEQEFPNLLHCNACHRDVFG